MITITKKESLFLSVYHTVWMLHKAKTARLVITLYRHITDKLPTSYRHITNCWPTVGRLIVYVLGKTCQPTDGQQMADSRPTVGRQTANSRPTDGRQSANRRLTGFLGSSSSQLPLATMESMCKDLLSTAKNFLSTIEGSIFFKAAA